MVNLFCCAGDEWVRKWKRERSHSDIKMRLVASAFQVGFEEGGSFNAQGRK
jgi:hypothetical protein